MLFAETATDLANLAQYGVLGLVVLGFVFGKIVPGYILDRYEKALAERDAKIERMTQAFEERALPTILKSANTLDSAMRIIENFERDEQKRRGGG
jgi:hypothetical protein